MEVLKMLLSVFILFSISKKRGAWTYNENTDVTATNGVPVDYVGNFSKNKTIGDISSFQQVQLNYSYFMTCGWNYSDAMGCPNGYKKYKLLLLPRTENKIIRCFCFGYHLCYSDNVVDVLDFATKVDTTGGYCGVPGSDNNICDYPVYTTGFQFMKTYRLTTTFPPSPGVPLPPPGWPPRFYGCPLKPL